MFGRLYRSNPKFLIGPSEFAMLKLWRQARSGGMLGGGGHLPDPGGMFDQAAIMMDAFAVMDGADAQLRDRGK